VGVFRLRKVYMAFQSARFIHIFSYLKIPCALTAHFHPYPTEVGRLFSVTLAVLRRSEAPPVRWRGALYCPDFPPVPHRSAAKGDKVVCNSGAKLMGSLGFLWVNSGIVYCFEIKNKNYFRHSKTFYYLCIIVPVH
jgi:hypothetical protein